MIDIEVVKIFYKGLEHCSNPKNGHEGCPLFKSDYEYLCNKFICTLGNVPEENAKLLKAIMDQHAYEYSLNNGWK